MANFEHSVSVSELVIFKSPWDWLNKNIGTRLDGAWDITWNDFGSDIGDEAVIRFRNKEDAARFVLTWL